LDKIIVNYWKLLSEKMRLAASYKLFLFTYLFSFVFSYFSKAAEGVILISNSRQIRMIRFIRGGKITI